MPPKGAKTVKTEIIYIDTAPDEKNEVKQENDTTPVPEKLESKEIIEISDTEPKQYSDTEDEGAEQETPREYKHGAYSPKRERTLTKKCPERKTG